MTLVQALPTWKWRQTSNATSLFQIARTLFALWTRLSSTFALLAISPMHPILYQPISLLTKRFTTVEPRHPRIDKFHEVQKRQWTVLCGNKNVKCSVRWTPSISIPPLGKHWCSDLRVMTVLCHVIWFHRTDRHEHRQTYKTGWLDQPVCCR